MHVDRTRTASSKEDMRKDVHDDARNRDPPDCGARRRARVHNARLLLAELSQEREAVQGEIQTRESYSCSYGREAVPLSLPRMRQSVRQVREPQDTQEDAYR